MIVAKQKQGPEIACEASDRTRMAPHRTSVQLPSQQAVQRCVVDNKLSTDVISQLYSATTAATVFNQTHTTTTTKSTETTPTKTKTTIGTQPPTPSSIGNSSVSTNNNRFQ